MSHIEALRTPDDRFADLPGFHWKPRYVDELPGCAGLRMHYVDAGPPDAARVFLCLHGEPTWSYLYRRMIPVFSDAGHRVVAPDWFGFGRSDKPVDDDVYTFDFHRGSVIALIEQLDLRGITLVCQDWGGLLGLTLPMDMPERIDGLMMMNTALGTGDYELTPGFLAWRQWVRDNPDFEPGRLLGRTCPHLTDAEAAAYDAPFPDASHKAGVRRFPEMVPDHPEAAGAELSRRARDWLRDEWSGRSFMAVGATDPVLGPPVMNALRQLIRDCPEPWIVEDGSHFLQEWGGPVARRALEVLG